MKYLEQLIYTLLWVFPLVISSSCSSPEHPAKVLDFASLESKEGLTFSGEYPVLDTAQRNAAIRNGRAGKRFTEKTAYAQALSALLKVVPYYNADAAVRQELPLFYTYLAKTAIGNLDYETAIKAYNLALNNDSALLNRDGQYLRGTILLQISNIYFKIKQYDQSKDFMTLSETLARDYKNQHLKIEVQLMKGELALGKKYYDKALKQFNRANRTAAQYGFRELKIAAINDLARFYCIADSVGPAMVIVQEIQDTVKSMQAAPAADSALLFMLLSTSGKVYYTAGRYEAAEQLFEKALQYYQLRNQPQDIVDTYEDLYKTYKASHKTPQALAALEEYIAVREKLINARVLRNASEISLKYKVSERDRQLAGHQLELANKEVEAKAAIQRWATVAGVLSIGLLLLVIYQIIQKNRMSMMKKEQQLNVYKAVMQGEEHERTRIAENLHDGIGALLATVKLDMAKNAAANAAAGNGYVYTADTPDPVALVNEIAEEVRRIAHNLMPDILVKNTMEQAFIIYCNNVHRSTRIDVQLQYIAELDNCSHQSKLLLYRITQELLQNVIKHASATEVFLQVRQKGDELNIMFEDNGKGFDLKENRNGMGLKNIKLRVAALGGEMELSSSPGNGTTVFLSFNIPLLEKYSVL